MKYKEFKKYIKQIVLYQSGNNYNKNRTLRSKCLINFTTRQLASKTGRSHTTIANWLKKLRTEKVIAFSHYKKSKDKKFNDMKFFIHLGVIRILKAKANVRAYKFIKKFTLKKYINIYIKNYKLLWFLDMQNPMIDMGKFGKVDFFDLDMRKHDNKKEINYLPDEKINFEFSRLISSLSV